MGTVLLFFNILLIYFKHSLYLVNVIIIIDLHYNIY